MSEIRPVDLPEIRASLVREHVPRPPFEDAARGYAACGLSEGEVEEARQEAMRTAELYFVATAMGEVAAAASPTLPAYTLASEDMPSPKGLIVFGGPPEYLIERNLTRAIAGALWITAPGSHGRTFVLVFPVVDNALMAELKGEAWRAGRKRWSCRAAAFPLTLDGQPSPFEWGSDWTMNSMRVLKSTWLLMQQPLAVTGEVEVDRAARKRLRREGQDPSPVRVIELRRPKGLAERGDGDREYHHQWIVKGHWRQQWHPKRQVHRPVWIAPHIKGPEGAPLIGGEKVYAWKK